MPKTIRFNKKKVLGGLLAVLSVLILSASSTQASGNWPTLGNSSYANVQWRSPTNCHPWSFIAGDKKYDNSWCAKETVSLGKVRVLDFTTSHFPVRDAVNTVNQYLASNSNMFRLEYASPYQPLTNCSGHQPCISIQETNGPMGALGETITSGSFCSLSGLPRITMSWPNMYQYSVTARRGALIHEIYHAFGLSNHSADKNDLMYGAAGEPSKPTAGINRGTPSANDSKRITDLYGRWGTSALVPC